MSFHNYVFQNRAKLAEISRLTEMSHPGCVFVGTINDLDGARFTPVPGWERIEARAKIPPSPARGSVSKQPDSTKPGN